MSTKIIIEPHYFPCIYYFANIINAQEIYIETQEYYIKQTYRNRCYIKGANQIERLSIPVLQGSSSQKLKTKDIRLDHSQRWKNIHWRSICSAYGKAPFFIHYADMIEAVFTKPYSFLLDFNLSLLTLCLQILQTPKKIIQTIDYQPVIPHIVDMRNSLLPEKNDDLTVPIYQQVFGNTFVKNLSILDLLFCEGTKSYQYLQNIHQQLSNHKN